jgi:hypothetical protein
MKTLLSFIVLCFRSFFVIIGQIFIGDISSVSKTIDIKYDLQKKDNTLNYEEYETTPEKYDIWLDKIFNRIGLPDLATSLLIAIIVFLGGYLIAISIHFGKDYLNTLAVYLISFGIFLTAYTVRKTTRKIHLCMANLRPCFMLSDNEFFYFLNTWFKRFSNSRILIVIITLPSLLLATLLYYKLYDEEVYNTLNLLSLELTSFKVNDWYEQPFLSAKFFLFMYFIIIICCLLITSFRLLFVNFFFLLDILRLPIIPIPNLIRLRMGDLSNLYLSTSFNWFIGVSLFGVMLFTALDWLSVSVLLLISLVGLLTFLIPQIIYSKMLYKSQQIATHWIFSSFYKKMDIDIKERNVENMINSENASKIFQLNSLSEFFEASKPVKKTIYSLPQLSLFILGQTISILT